PFSSYKTFDQLDQNFNMNIKRIDELRNLISVSSIFEKYCQSEENQEDKKYGIETITTKYDPLPSSSSLVIRRLSEENMNDFE
ncbi:11218_t:CDS:2, partial [Gigaspora rosea]